MTTEAILQILGIVFLCVSNCFAVETIKATGVARARIVAPVVIEWEEPINSAIVWTEVGPTQQVVF